MFTPDENARTSARCGGGSATRSSPRECKTVALDAKSLVELGTKHGAHESIVLANEDVAVDVHHHRLDHQTAGQWDAVSNCAPKVAIRFHPRADRRTYPFRDVFVGQPFNRRSQIAANSRNLLSERGSHLVGVNEVAARLEDTHRFREKSLGGGGSCASSRC